nr:MAG TPA: hypothetical protein [Caudoviricetes sp.]
MIMRSFTVSNEMGVVICDILKFHCKIRHYE